MNKNKDNKNTKKNNVKQKILIEYEVTTAKCTVTCQGMTKRSQAYKVLQKASRVVYKTWGGKGGLESIGIKSDLKEKNIEAAKRREKEVKLILEKRIREIQLANKLGEEFDNNSNSDSNSNSNSNSNNNDNDSRDSDNITKREIVNG